MSDALEQALRTLRHRERSSAEIERYLESRGVEETERHEALATLVRTSLVDDRRYAQTRAAALAERGAGDRLIRHDLAAAGVTDDLAADAVASLPSERERASAIVERRGASARTARYLAGKGFAPEVVETVVAHAGSEPLG